MKIKSINLYKIQIPMAKPFKTGFGNISEKPTVIARLETSEGLMGWGESAALPFPNYKPETVDTCMMVIEKYIAPLLMQKKIASVPMLNNLMKPIKGNNLAKTGIETAFWSIESQRKNEPLYKLLGGINKKILIGESIGIQNSISETLDIISLRLAQGFKRIKVKIQPGWDIKIVKAIRNKFPNIPLMVDANSSYTLKDEKTLQELDSYNLLMIEQPLGDDDIIDHSSLQKVIKTPICLDESINSAEDARKAIKVHACRIINIKPGRVGGLEESKKIHDVCRENNIDVWVGGMLESGIGRCFNAALATLEGCKYPADMSPNGFYFKDSITDNTLDAVDGTINVPQKSGVGIELNQNKIKKYTVGKITIN